MMKKKFYSEGIFFSCTGCGKCCRQPEGWIEMTASELADASSLLGIKPEEFIRIYTTGMKNEKYHIRTNSDGACIFIDNENRCTVYNARPLHCRTYPFWPENLKSIHRWEQTKTTCEGIEAGDFFSFEQIREILNRQRNKKR